MVDRHRIETPDVIEEVEEYVSKELRDAEQYENSTPLDESGIWDLHAMAARIYARGYEAGERAEDERNRRAASRGRDRVQSTAEQRLTAAKRALVETGYFNEDEVSDDLAPRITELWVKAHGEAEAPDEPLKRTPAGPYTAAQWLMVLRQEDPAGFRDIFDPDGWRRGDGVDLDTPLTREEFMARYNASTTGPMRDGMGVLGRALDAASATS